MLFLGIDGGGSKTRYALCNETGMIVGEAYTGSTDFKQHGQTGVLKTLAAGTDDVCKQAGVSRDALTGVCFGMPCFGEHLEDEKPVIAAIRAFYAPASVYVCNDVEVGWAGSLALADGIHIVGGTGAIAFGRDASHKTARSGGWGECSGDEGSGYWLGKQFMSLFAKQADLRLPRGPLYDIARTALKLGDNDFDFIELMEQDYMPYRDKVASLQMVLYDAAEAGDPSAVKAYADAGRELALLAHGVKSSLCFAEGTPVSYWGGIFRAGAFVLDAFGEALAKEGFVMRTPLLEPVYGAVLLAAENFSEPAVFQTIQERLLHP